MIGATASAIAAPISDKANCTALIFCCCLSIGSNVASNVFATVPLASFAVPDSFSSEKAPRLMASTIRVAPLVPNTLEASVSA